MLESLNFADQARMQGEEKSDVLLVRFGPYSCKGADSVGEKDISEGAAEGMAAYEGSCAMIGAKKTEKWPVSGQGRAVTWSSKRPTTITTGGGVTWKEEHAHCCIAGDNPSSRIQAATYKNEASKWAQT